MMYKHLFSLTAMAVALLLGGVFQATASTQHDNLLLKRVHKEARMHLPTRGMTMTQVEKTFGAPQRKLPPRGGDTPLHPVIHRWVYPGYIVYFERNRVIHSVLNTPAGNNTHPIGTH